MSYPNHQIYGHPWPPDSTSAGSRAHDSGSYQQHHPNFPPPPPPPPPPPMYGPNATNFYPGSLVPNFANAGGSFPSRPPPLPFSNPVPAPYHSYGAPPVTPLGFPPFQPVSHPQPRGDENSGTSTPNAVMSTAQESRLPAESEGEETGDMEEGELEEEMSVNDDNDQSKPKSTGNVDPNTGSFNDEGFDRDQGHSADSSATGYLGAPAPQTNTLMSLRGTADDLSRKPAHGSPILPRSGTVESPNNSASVSQKPRPNKLLGGSDVTIIEPEVITGSIPNGKSPSQLRKLAQGALLNLAPHNIRFQELVEEGIDPVILKALYYEIGIKVLAEVPGDRPPSSRHVPQTLSTELELPPRAESPHSVVSSVTSTPSLTENTPTAFERDAPVILQPQQAGGGARHALVAENIHAKSAQPSGKPLERKDLIARMLAAKAGKSATSDITTQPKEQSQLVITTATCVSGVPDDEQSPIDPRAEVRVKEINKAQTELAKQRMEQLKKEGLRRSQTNNGDSGSLSLSTSVDSNGSSIQMVTPHGAPMSSQPRSLRHPLPDRPPGLNEEVSVRIPGLFMTGSDSPGPQQRLGGITESGDQPTTKPLRKRPRASDFTDDDEDMVEVPLKKPSPQGRRLTGMEHRVVIDVSDDESMYGGDASDGDGSDEVEFSGRIPHSTSALALRNQPPLSEPASAGGYSNISTPPISSVSQSPRRPEHLQMEILNLRQQIAERERRRNEKLLAATQAQSAQALNISGIPAKRKISTTALDQDQSHSNVDAMSVTPATQSIYGSRPVHAGEKSNIAPSSMVRSFERGTSNPDLGPSIGFDVSRSPSNRPRSSLGPKNAEEIRQKLLRRQEIESGLPILDDELLKSEARLAECKDEMQKLLAEIAKGKEGRLKLVRELQDLGIETEGLTLEELQQAKDSFENSVEAIDDTVSTEPHGSPAPVEVTTLHPSEVAAVNDIHQSLDEIPVSESVIVAKDNTLADAVEPSFEALGDGRGETHEVDRFSCSSSAMDESMGSDNESVEQVSDDGAFAPLGSPPTLTPDIGRQRVLDEENTPSSVGAPTEVVGSRSKIDDVSDETQLYNTSGNESPSRKSSLASEAYEPPEPLAEPNPIYSPEFSPAPPDAVDQMDMEVQASSLSSNPDGLKSDNQDSTPAVDVEMLEKEDQGPLHQYFTPYESPLSRFRAYRYHPDFTDSVKGGFRSLTYSHKINPHNPICEYEASGGVCNDRSCPYQHFRDISLSDDKILVEMGSLREGKTPQEQEEYVAGLRQIITDMRRDKVKDFTTVATEIAAYRRRFLQDPSRVLAM